MATTSAEAGMPANVQAALKDQYMAWSSLCTQAGGAAVNQTSPGVVGFISNCSESRHGAFTVDLRVEGEAVRLSAQFDFGWRAKFHADVAELLVYQGQIPSLAINEGPSSFDLSVKIGR